MLLLFAWGDSMSNFRYYRVKKGLSQKSVGDFLGITGQAYSNYENNKREADYETLLKLSELFETSIENLISDTPIESNDITFDDFTYAFYNESKELTEEKKEQLLEMARFFKQQQDKKKEK